jgi:YD repeat-containing protein
VRFNEIVSARDRRCGFALTQTAAFGAAYAADDISAYDANGRVTSRKNGLGQETTFAYDGFDRPVTVTVRPGTTGRPPTNTAAK